MNDEELVEAIFDSLLTTVASPLEFATNGESPLNDVHLMDAAKEALAALRSAGFQVVRIADLAGAVSTSRRLIDEVRYFDDHSPAECVVVRTADYAEAALDRLVPADSGGSG